MLMQLTGDKRRHNMMYTYLYFNVDNIVTHLNRM
jgi:hypothetical protein